MASRAGSTSTACGTDEDCPGEGNTCSLSIDDCYIDEGQAPAHTHAVDVDVRTGFRDSAGATRVARFRAVDVDGDGQVKITCDDGSEEPVSDGSSCSVEPNEDRSWTALELHEALNQYEQELRDNGLRRNTVNTYVQHPERFIRWLTDEYSPTGPRSENRDPLAKTRSKYDPLHNYLVNLPERSVRMPFSQIERILGLELPSSARGYYAWWENQRDGNHSHARSWLDAHYETQWLDLNSQAVTFTSPRLDS